MAGDAPALQWYLTVPSRNYCRASASLAAGAHRAPLQLPHPLEVSRF